MSNNTIEIKINSGGTLEVVTIPVKLYKDSYKAVKLRVKAPKVEDAILKVYGSDRDEAGEEVWTTSAHTLSWKEYVVINGQDYSVYEDYIPEEFCQKNGELYLTFGLGIMGGESWTAILTSGTLNLYVSGEGFNFAGVEIPESDKLAYKINKTFENYERLSEDIERIDQLADDIESAVNTSQDALNKAEEALSKVQDTSATKVLVNGVKVDVFDADTKANVGDLDGKVDKVVGKGLSTYDFDDVAKSKLDGVEEGANKTIVDSVLSKTSTNPVQNKVIAEALENMGTGSGDLSNYYTKSETYSKSEVDDKLANISTGTDIVADSELDAESENPVQNKVLYNPVSFAESERQKSKNLFKTPFTTSGFTYGGITFELSDNGKINVYGTRNVSSGITCVLIKNLTLKAGTYTCSANKVLEGMFIQTNMLNYMNLLPSGKSSHTFTLTEDTTFTEIYIGIGVSNGQSLDMRDVFIQLEEGNVATDYQAYNGKIVHEKEIADVEHVELLYDKNDTQRQTIGNGTYTSGIIGTVVVGGVDFTKYKQLRIYVNLSGVCSDYSVDLNEKTDWWVSSTNTSYEDVCSGGTFVPSKDSSNLLCHVVRVQTQLNKLETHMVGYFLPQTSFTDRKTYDTYFIYKIEGVLT